MNRTRQKSLPAPALAGTVATVRRSGQDPIRSRRKHATKLSASRFTQNPLRAGETATERSAEIRSAGKSPSEQPPAGSPAGSAAGNKPRASRPPALKKHPVAKAAPAASSFWPRFKTELLDGNEHNKLFQSWLKDLCLAEGARSKEMHLTLQIPSPLHKKWAAENILPLLQARAGRHYGKPCQISFQVFSKNGGSSGLAPSSAPAAAPASGPAAVPDALPISLPQRRAGGSFFGQEALLPETSPEQTGRPETGKGRGGPQRGAPPQGGTASAGPAKSLFNPARLPETAPPGPPPAKAVDRRPAAQTSLQTPPLPQPARRLRNRSQTAFFHPDYLFDNFVVGKNNEFAREVCFCLTQRRSAAFNPIFIHGPSGVGKTHLLNAIGWEFAANCPEKRIHYLSAEKFLNECIHSIQKREMKKFQKKYRIRCDLLLLDDIQMIARGTAVQEEFFHTFNELFSRGAPVVVCCDSPPSRVPGLEDRLRSRMEGGLVAEISYPDWETRVAILKSKAEKKRLELPDKILFQIARNHRRSIREMEGALNKIKMLSDLKGGPLSLDYIQGLLEKAAPRPVTALEIQKKAAKKFHVSLEEALSLSRKKEALLARQTAMYFIKTKLRKSLSDTGRLFGGKDHSTVVNSLKKVEKLKAKDPEFQLILEELQNDLDSLTKTD